METDSVVLASFSPTAVAFLFYGTLPGPRSPLKSFVNNIFQSPYRPPRVHKRPFG